MLGPVLHDQTQLCFPLGQNKKCGGKPEGEADLEDTHCQELHVLPQSFRAAVETLWSWNFSIPGLVDVAGGQANAKEFFCGAYPLGSCHFRVCLVEGYACLKNTSCSLLAGQGNHWWSPSWVLGASSSERLSSARFAYQRLQWGMRLLGFIPVFAEGCTSLLLG